MVFSCSLIQCVSGNAITSASGHRKSISISITDRRAAARTLLGVRQASRYWNQLATHLISSIRVGEMEDLTTTRQRMVMLEVVQSCRNLQSLTVRNLDWLTDADLARSITEGGLSNLRSLNVGGCVRLTDGIILAIRDLPLEQLNLSVTKVSDVGLGYLGEGRAIQTLSTITLYGISEITEPAIIALVKVLPCLSHINIRSTEIDYDAGQRIKASCLNPNAQILTGSDLGNGSVYGRT